MSLGYNWCSVESRTTRAKLIFSKDYWLQGFALVGPALHFWYSTLARLITKPGTQGTALQSEYCPVPAKY